MASNAANGEPIQESLQEPTCQDSSPRPSAEDSTLPHPSSHPHCPNCFRIINPDSTGSLSPFKTNNTAFPARRRRFHSSACQRMASLDGSSLTNEEWQQAGQNPPSSPVPSKILRNDTTHLGLTAIVTTALGSTACIPQADSTASTPPASPMVSTVPLKPPPCLPNGHFPQRFGFYNHPYTINILGTNDMFIASNRRDHKTRYLYISVRPHFILWGKWDPWVTIHSGPTRRSLPLATIKHSLGISTNTSRVNIDMRPLPPLTACEKAAMKRRYKRDKRDHKVTASKGWKAQTGRAEVLKEAHEVGCFKFAVVIPSTGEREKFQWEKCIVTGIEGLEDGFGKNLIRKKTGEVVAGWTRPRHYNSSKPKLGKMAFVGCWKTLGQDFELLAVLSILASMQNAGKWYCGSQCSSEQQCTTPPRQGRPIYQAPPNAYGVAPMVVGRRM